MSVLAKLFNPRGVAVVGARQDLSRGGGQPLYALLTHGYQGRVYPVNPKYEEIAGVKCYPSVRDIDGPCDLAVLAIPAAGIVEAVKDCGARGIGYAVVYGGGFREIGAEGVAREKELVRVARESGVRLIGPNCLGLVNVTDRVYAAFGSMTRDPRLRTGSVSMVYQSGGFGHSIALHCHAAGAGFRFLVASGNEVDITAPELIDAYLEDEQTRIVVAYLEGVVDGRALMAAGRKAMQLGKVILAWKAGNTDQGKRVAATHTASMTGTYDVYRAALRQSGIIEVHSFDEIADLVNVFGTGRLPRGRRIAVIGGSGGSAIVFADTADQYGLSLPVPAAETLKTLRGLVHDVGSTMNPIDLTAGYTNDGVVDKFAGVVNAMLDDPNVDQLCVMLATVNGRPAENGARALAAATRRTDKPILVFSSVPRDTAKDAYQLLEEARIPVLSSPTHVARAAALTAAYVEARARHMPPTAGGAVQPARPLELPAGAGALSEVASKALLSAYGVAITRDVVIPIGGNPGRIDVSPPYAVKVLSPDVPHKTEAGGVRLNVASTQALRKAMAEVAENAQRTVPGARLEGVLVSEMVTDAVEAMIGVVNDPVFGPVVAFGLGGIFAEVLHDLSYRVAPFDEETARTMLGELRGKAILDGVRGMPACDTDALVAALAAVSRLAWDLRERLKELDVNPLLVRPRGMGAVAADALIVLR